MSAFKYLPNCREICTHHVFQGQLWFAFVLLERHFSNFYFCSDGGMAEIKDKPPPVSFQHGILEIATEYSIGRIRPAFIALKSIFESDIADHTELNCGDTKLLCRRWKPSDHWNQLLINLFWRQSVI